MKEENTREYTKRITSFVLRGRDINAFEVLKEYGNQRVIEELEKRSNTLKEYRKLFRADTAITCLLDDLEIDIKELKQEI